MNTAELIFEKARRSAETEAAEWRKLLRETQSAPGVAALTDEDIAREISTVCAR